MELKFILGTFQQSRTLGNPNSSIRIRLAKGPPAPCIPSNIIAKSGRLANADRAGKSKHVFKTLTYSSKGSIIVTFDVDVN